MTKSRDNFKVEGLDYDAAAHRVVVDNPRLILRGIEDDGTGSTIFGPSQGPVDPAYIIELGIAAVQSLAGAINVDPVSLVAVILANLDSQDMEITYRKKGKLNG